MMCETQTTIHQNAIIKMGGQCDATSNEIMTPKTFFANIQLLLVISLHYRGEGGGEGGGGGGVCAVCVCIIYISLDV